MIVAPLAGRLLNVSASSVQLLSATCLMFCTWPEESLTNIRSVASGTERPLSDCRLNFRYPSLRGEESVWTVAAWPKLKVGLSELT